ncbi:MAG: hypothetical protein ACRECL_13660 [Bradyrhizobium sp.]
MTIPLRLENRADVRPAPPVGSREDLLPTAKPAASRERLEPSTADLAFRIVSALRAHPHISNVLTHVSRAKWREVEQSLNRILDLSTTGDGLSPLEENIIDLMVGERGVTGKILKPYFQAALRRLLEPGRAERLIRHINALYLELEWKVQHPAPSVPAPNEPSEGSGDARGQ